MAPSSTRMRSAAALRTAEATGDLLGLVFTLISLCNPSPGSLALATLSQWERERVRRRRSIVLPLPCGERDGVRGFRALLFCCADYRFKNTIDVLQYIVVPEAKDKIAHRF